MRTRIVVFAALAALAVQSTIPVVAPAAAARASTTARPAPTRVAIRAPGRRCALKRCIFIHLKGHRMSRKLARCLKLAGLTLFGSIIGGVIGGAVARSIAGAVVGGSASACLGIALGVARDTYHEVGSPV